MAILTVNPGGGAMYTTLSSACNAAGLSDIVEVQADIYENLVFYKQVPLIRGQAGIHPKWHPSTTGSQWLINGAMSGENKISNIHFSGAWNAPQIDHNATTFGQVIVIEDCTFSPDAGNDQPFPQCIRIRPQGLNFENVILNRCRFIWGGATYPTNHITVDQTNALDAIEIINCAFSHADTSIYIQGGTAHTVSHMHNNSWNNVTRCIDSTSNIFVTNCSLLSVNTSGNLSLTGNASPQGFEYNTMANADLGENWGYGNVFDVIRANEYISSGMGAAEDLHLKNGAQAIDAAVDDPLPYHPGLAVDMEQAARPGSSPWDVGAYIFIDAPQTIQRRRMLQY